MYLSAEKMQAYRKQVKELRNSACEVKICLSIDSVLVHLAINEPVPGKISSPDVLRILSALGIEVGEYDSITASTPVSLAEEF